MKEIICALMITIIMGVGINRATAQVIREAQATKDTAITPDKTLKTGDQCPDYVFVDTAGKKVNLSMLKGKYVYIDIWASWCNPCRKEYPHLDTLREKMKDRNIVFLSLSCDTQGWRWKGALYFNHMTGLQWLDKDEVLLKDFKVATVPRFILLDQEGKVINDKMTRPSQPETETYLKQLNHI